MGRYSYSNRPTESESLCLDTQWLKENGYFRGGEHGRIAWTHGYSGKESSVGFFVDITDDNPKIHFQYSTKRWDETESKGMDYSFPLIKVPCNLGGFRWAFKCGLWSKSVYCGRRVHKLYKANSDYFGCRKCMKIVYDSQRDSGRKYEFLGKILKSERKFEKLYPSIKKWHYRGKPTKKVMRLRKLEAQIPPTDQAEKIFNSLLGSV